MTKRAIIFLRASTADHSAKNQLPELKKICKENDWKVMKVIEKERSAWKGNYDSLKMVSRLAENNEFDVLVVWSLDRLDRRGIMETLQSLKKLNDIGIKLYSYQEPYLSTLDPLTRDLIISVLSWVSKMESERISERVKAGMRRARENGQKLGRPRTTTRKQREKIRQIYRERDMTYDDLAKVTGHPKTTVFQIVKENE